MGWKAAASTEGSSNLPVLKVESGQNKRVRFLDEAASPQLAGTKYADGPIDIWQHWTPDALSEQLGGGRTVPCIGPRNGCIFHSEPYNWKASKRNAVNCVEYVNYDAKKKTFDEKRIVGYLGGSKIFGQILTHTQSVGGDSSPGSFDFLLSRKGTGKEDTTWTATLISTPLEETINLTEFPDQEEYGDDDIPSVVDFHKFPGAAEIRTAAQQRKWLEELLAGGEQPEEGEAEAEEAKAPPKSPVAPKAVAAPIGMDVKRGRGRPPKAPGATAAAPVAKAPPAPAKAAPAPPKLHAVPDPYIAASAVLDPWGTKLSESEHLDFILDATGDTLTEYQITDEMVAAAKAVKKGPLPAAPAAPARPPAPKAPAAAKASEPEVEETEDESFDAESMRAQIKKAMLGSDILKSFAGAKKFYAHYNVKALNGVEDPDTLQEMLALAQANESDIAEELG